MSKVRTKRLRRVGLQSKSIRRKARKYIYGFVKGNRYYAVNNFAFHNEKLQWFSTYANKGLFSTNEDN